jgi:ABC-type amino acid transport system permease subunit
LSALSLPECRDGWQHPITRRPVHRFLVLPLYGIRINSLSAGVLGLAINSSAYAIEIVRVGFAAILAGQY